MDHVKPGTERVILLHGLAAHRVVMTRLARRLGRDGFEVHNWGYPSVRAPIARHASRLRSELEIWDQSLEVSRIHLVTHSMGSIITRCALSTFVPSKLGRIVMLGPPNGGSHAARRLAPWLGWLCPPLRELSDDPSSWVNQLPNPVALPAVGIVAAERDRVVARNCTRLLDQLDWIMLPGHHGMLPWRSETATQVISFLRQGTFSHSPSHSAHHRETTGVLPTAPC